MPSCWTWNGSRVPAAEWSCCDRGGSGCRPPSTPLHNVKSDQHTVTTVLNGGRDAFPGACAPGAPPLTAMRSRPGTVIRDRAGRRGARTTRAWDPPVIAPVCTCSLRSLPARPRSDGRPDPASVRGPGRRRTCTPGSRRLPAPRSPRRPAVRCRSGPGRGPHAAVGGEEHVGVGLDLRGPTGEFGGVPPGAVARAASGRPAARQPGSPEANAPARSGAAGTPRAWTRRSTRGTAGYGGAGRSPRPRPMTGSQVCDGRAAGLGGRRPPERPRPRPARPRHDPETEENAAAPPAA